MHRRRFLAAGLAGAAGALAGCADSSDQIPSNRPEDPGAGDEESTEPEPAYRIEFAVGSRVDLTTLPSDRDQLERIDEIRDEHYLRMRATVYRRHDGSEEALDIDPAFTVDRDPVSHEEVGDLYRIPCTALSQGDNLVAARIIVDGERVEETRTAFKYVPEHEVQLLEPGQEPEDVTDTPYRFHVYDEPDRSRHREHRDEYVDYVTTGGDFDATEFVDETVGAIDTRGAVPDTISSLAAHWFEAARAYDLSPLLRSEKLAATIEYAFREHLGPDVQAGSVGHHDTDAKETHYTVLARDPETETLWHVATDGSGTTVEPGRARVVTEDRFVSGLDVEESLAGGHRENAEMAATAFTRTEFPGSELREKLVHTDAALADVTELLRRDGDFGTVATAQIDALTLANGHEYRQFVLDRASETGAAEADLELRARKR